jgi:hypothetical protein
MSAPPQPRQETLARTVLPRLKHEATDEQLQQAFAEHLQQPRGHAVDAAKQEREGKALQKLGKHATCLAEKAANEPAVRY